MTRDQIVKLAATVFCAVTLIVIGDTAGKTMTAGGVDPLIVAWSRFGLAAIVLLPLSGATLREVSILSDWQVLIRGGFITLSIVCILTALKTEPIANVFGALFIGPVVSFILAMVFLGEKPTVLRSILLGLGFFGVMLVVKPGVNMSTGMIFAVVAGISHGAYLMTTRLVASRYRPRLLLVSQLLIGACVLTPLGLSAEMPTLSLGLGTLIVISAMGSAAGNFLLVVASKRAQASLIAPLVYSQLISATVIGIVIFGDWPDLYSMCGLLLIAASGVGSLIVSHPEAFARRAK